MQNEYQDKAIKLSAGDESAEAKCSTCGEDCPYCTGKMPKPSEDDMVNESYGKSGDVGDVRV